MLWAILCGACPLVWSSPRWRLRTGSCAVGTKPYRTTTCPGVWASGLAYAGASIFIVLLEAGCNLEDAGEGPGTLCVLCVSFGAQHGSLLPGLLRVCLGQQVCHRSST